MTVHDPHVTCRDCGFGNADTSKFCVKCGRPLAESRTRLEPEEDRTALPTPAASPAEPIGVAAEADRIPETSPFLCCTHCGSEPTTAAEFCGECGMLLQGVMPDHGWDVQHDTMVVELDDKDATDEAALAVELGDGETPVVEVAPGAADQTDALAGGRTVDVYQEPAGRLEVHAPGPVACVPPPPADGATEAATSTAVPDRGMNELVSGVEPQGGEATETAEAYRLPGGDLERVISGTSEPLVVGFGSKGDAASEAMVTAIARAVAASGGASRFVLVDVEADPGDAAYCGVDNVPSVLVFRHGRAVAHVEGAVTELTVGDLIRFAAGASTPSAKPPDTGAGRTEAPSPAAATVPPPPPPPMGAPTPPPCDGRVPVSRLRFRFRWTHVAAVLAGAVIAVLVAIATGDIPFLVTKAAFTDLRAIDAAGAVAVPPGLIVLHFADKSPTDREQLVKLNTVLSGGTSSAAVDWLNCGRRAKYAAALGFPVEASLSSLRPYSVSGASDTETTARGLKALRTIAWLYSRWPLRSKGIVALAGELGVEPETDRIRAVISDRYTQILAKEERDRLAEEARQDAIREAEYARQQAGWWQWTQSPPVDNGGANYGYGRQTDWDKGDAIAAQAEAAELRAVQERALTGVCNFGRACALWVSAAHAYEEAGRRQEMIIALRRSQECSSQAQRPSMSNREAAETLGGLP